MTIDAGLIVMTGAPVEYGQDKNRKRTLAGAANATGTSAEHTANLTDGGVRGVN